MDNAIEITGLSKSFDSVDALSDLNLKVEQGAIFGLLGPNGAGKTTTIKALTGRLSFSKGEVLVLGKNIRKEMKEIHQSIGVVSETQNLYDHLTVWENIDFFRQLYAVSASTTSEIIERLSLQEKKNKRVSSLSKGLKQRVLLARSILHSPKLLFLDEPTSGIDPSSSMEVHRFIKLMKQQGTTIFLTSHDMEEVDSLCDKVAFINKGKIVATGTPKSLKKDYGKGEVEVSYVDNDSTEKKLIFSLNEKDAFSRISEIHSKYKILAVHTKEASMKDVFLSVVQKGKEPLK